MAHSKAIDNHYRLGNEWHGQRRCRQRGGLSSIAVCVVSKNENKIVSKGKGAFSVDKMN